MQAEWHSVDEQPELKFRLDKSSCGLFLVTVSGIVTTAWFESGVGWALEGEWAGFEENITHWTELPDAPGDIDESSVEFDDDACDAFYDAGIQYASEARKLAIKWAVDRKLTIVTRRMAIDALFVVSESKPVYLEELFTGELPCP